MTTQEKREFNLTLTLESNEIIKFMSNMDPEHFVAIHQDNFKDYYLSEPEILLDDYICEDLDLCDVICEKYREFFNNMGIEATYKWLNPSLYTNWTEYLKTEDFSMKVIKYEVFGEGELEDEDYDELEAFSELYGDISSGWGLSHFVIEIVENYYDYKNIEAEALIVKS